MINTQLDTTLERYEAAIKSLDGSNIEVEQVLDILHARDAVQVALKEPKHIPGSTLKRLILSDAELRQKAEVITQVIQADTWQNWRESVHPAAEAWWWRLESMAPHPWDNWDWLWKILSLAGWTVNISLLVNIATRFLSGGGVGFIGVAAVAVPGILTLLQASSELTKVGEEGFEKLLERLKIPKHYRQEAKLASTGMMFVILIGFWLALPSLSKIYNSNGLKNSEEINLEKINLEERNLGAAEKDFQRAISLDEDNIEAHYNLGNVYEDWLEFEKAKKHYQIAVADGLPQAHNNLGRLYIHEKKYPQAATLLAKGLVLAEDKNSTPEIKYSLFKNLGWARLQQGRYEEALKTLQAAVVILRNSDTKKHIPNPGAAHCLMAQVLEKQKAPSAQVLPHWQKCVDLGSVTNSDEDGWLYLAHQKLRKVKK